MKVKVTPKVHGNLISMDIAIIMDLFEKDVYGFHLPELGSD
jgi:hypothetical protein